MKQGSDSLNDITEDMAAMIEHTNSISNKEALKDKIHEIHNYLRNNGAGYGMSGLKVFNFLYGLKKIEETGLFDTMGLTEECRFSYLRKLANGENSEILADVILNKVLDSVSESKLKDLLFYEIPQNIAGYALGHIIKEIDKISIIEETYKDVQLSGKIYEYFIGRDESAISELGAYFTDRYIVRYCIEKANPQMNLDGSIPEMIDMFGGSGGFTTGYINHMIEMCKHTNQSINWATELNKISHFDMNSDVIKSAGLEFLCLTGVMPDMENNLKYVNSFTHEFGNKKYKYPITNPPYGGDKNKKSGDQIKRDKVKKYIQDEIEELGKEKKTSDEVQCLEIEGILKNRKHQLNSINEQIKIDKTKVDKTKVNVDGCSKRIQEFARKNKLTGNDKESCSLMLLMDIVDVGGTALGVLKEGVFFDGKYKDLRKCLIENFNVREVISVPSDQFENTTTGTSIIIFDNTEQKTTEVKFRDLVVDKIEEDKFEEVGGNIIITENKGDIVGVRDRLVSIASRDELLQNSKVSLNGKEYNKQEIIVGDGYELVKLGDICEFMPKSKRKASYGNTTGKFNFYTSSDKVQKCDVADYNTECLIIGDGGVANIKIDNAFSCSDHNHIIKTQYNTYIYNLIQGNMKLLTDGFNGSVLKNLSKDYLLNLKLPIPKSPYKIKYWVDKISKPYNEKNEKLYKSLIDELSEEAMPKDKQIIKLVVEKTPTITQDTEEDSE